MWLIRPLVSDPRLQFVGILILALVLMASLVGNRETACPECPGHQESARECLCYHVPVTADPSKR